MPGVEGEDAREEVDAVGREDRDDHLGVDGITVMGGGLDSAENGGWSERARGEKSARRNAPRRGEQRLTDDHVEREDGEAVDSNHVLPLGAAKEKGEERVSERERGTTSGKGLTPWVDCPSRRGSKLREDQGRDTAQGMTIDVCEESARGRDTKAVSLFDATNLADDVQHVDPLDGETLVLQTGRQDYKENVEVGLRESRSEVEEENGWASSQSRPTELGRTRESGRINSRWQTTRRSS